MAADKTGNKFAADRDKQWRLQPAKERLIADAAIHQLDIGRVQAISLIVGGRLSVNGMVYRANSSGDLITRQESATANKLWEKLRDVYGADITKLRFDPIGEYKKVIGKFFENL